MGIMTPAMAPEKIYRYSFFMLLIVIIFAPWGLISAQEDSESKWRSSAEYNFGQVMKFRLSGETDETMENVNLFMSAPDLESILMAEVQFILKESLDAQHAVDLTQVRLAPFTVVTYWWELETHDGKIIKIPEQTIDYIDDNLEWETAKDQNIVVHWTGDDPAIGQSALDAAVNAIPRLTSNIPISSDNLWRIYVYPRADDMQAALRLTGRNWVGAHAHPELGVVLVTATNAVSSEQDFANAISHELNHLLLYQVMGDNYQSLPLWLEEGMATIAELASNGQYEETLQNALESRTTIPFQELCHTFPADSDGSLLAYAQSASIVRFIQSEFGEHAPIQLVGSIADGANCENVTDEVLGVSLGELNDQWLEEVTPTSTLTRVWRQGRLLFFAIAVGFVLMSIIVMGPPRRK
jgi:hypothetical protein